MTTSKVIRSGRAAAGLTLAEVGAHLGVTGQHLTDVEHGRRPLHPRLWGKLVEIMPTVSLLDLAAARMADGGDVTLDVSCVGVEGLLMAARAPVA